MCYLDEAKHLCSVGTDVHKVTGNQSENQGLVEAHAYSIIGCHEIQVKGNTVKIIKLRNTHGWGEWKGSYSEDSPEMTDAIRKQIGINKAEDGLFTMLYDDYCKFFQPQLNIGYTVDKYYKRYEFVNPYAVYLKLDLKRQYNCQTTGVFVV